MRRTFRQNFEGEGKRSFDLPSPAEWELVEICLAPFPEQVAAVAAGLVDLLVDLQVAEPGASAIQSGSCSRDHCISFSKSVWSVGRLEVYQ